MAEINNSRFSASSAAATVPSDSEDEVELDPNSVELDPNSEEAKMLEATKDERRARVDAMLKKLEEEKRGPAIAREIDQALYTKAETHNADLSNEERALLLSRGDTMGKALAHPESLTAEEIYKVMGWGTPDTVHKLVRKWTKGTLSDPLELYAKAKDAFEQGRLDELSDGEIFTVASNFHATVYSVPGNREACRLIAGRLGIDVHVLLGVATYLGDMGMSGAQSYKERHQRTWQLSELPENDPNIPQSQIKRKYGEMDTGEARLEELLKSNRDGLASLKRILETIPWPEGVPRPSSTYESEQPSSSHKADTTTGRTGQAQLPKWFFQRGFGDFRRVRLAELGIDFTTYFLSEDVEMDIKQRWDALSQEEQDAQFEAGYRRRAERANKARSDRAK